MEIADSNQLLARQMLAILVMDLGYTEEPVYGRTPMRHQLAWHLVEEVLGVESIAKEVIGMKEQVIYENIRK